MAESITLYLHFPCFDGVVSAVLASEYLSRKRGWETREIVPVNYDRQATWAGSKLSEPAVVVDFLYHPRAIFWADHHQTSFRSESLRADYLKRSSSDLLYDPAASSCAELLWRKVRWQLNEPRFREMVEWARRIDGARYDTVEEAVLGNAPALRISQSFLNDSSDEYCRFLVKSLRVRTLAEVAASGMVRDRYASVRKAIERGQKLFSSSSRLEGNGIVVFQLPRRTGNTLVSRYAPYLAYPNARYSVGVFPYGNGAKITAMRNPWLRFKSIPLGQIFRHYGGGGHQRVASVLVNSVEEAETMLGAILKDIESQADGVGKKVKRSVSR
jgi:oligoribonuclease NrnB/cAMP/cGMP phosphodiesterase (DHH superfamily)